MQLTSIDATLRQLNDQLPTGQTQANTTDIFRSLIEKLSAQIKSAVADASAGAPSPATPSAPEAVAARTSQLTPFQQSLLRQPGGAMFEQLPDDLLASDPLYNEREATFRDGLDLTGIEQRLQSTAKGLGVQYDRSDLDGILRHAGYGAAHLGSTERYMAAVEQFVGEAEKQYQQRAGNKPGGNA